MGLGIKKVISAKHVISLTTSSTTNPKRYFKGNYVSSLT